MELQSGDSLVRKKSSRGRIQVGLFAAGKIAARGYGQCFDATSDARPPANPHRNAARLIHNQHHLFIKSLQIPDTLSQAEIDTVTNQTMAGKRSWRIK